MEIYDMTSPTDATLSISNNVTILNYVPPRNVYLGRREALAAICKIMPLESSVLTEIARDMDLPKYSLPVYLRFHDWVTAANGIKLRHSVLKRIPESGEYIGRGYRGHVNIDTFWYERDMRPECNVVYLSLHHVDLPRPWQPEYMNYTGFWDD
jgi:hypothetical protein